MKLLEGKAKIIPLQNVNRNVFFSTISNSEVDYWVFHMAPFFEMKNYQYATEKKTSNTGESFWIMTLNGWKNCHDKILKWFFLHGESFFSTRSLGLVYLPCHDESFAPSPGWILLCHGEVVTTNIKTTTCGIFTYKIIRTTCVICTNII